MNNQDIVRALLDMGLNRAQIARLVGRNSRVITHLERGEKPYRNLSGVLGEIHTRAEGLRSQGRAVTPDALTPHEEAPRRLNKAGRTARTRGAKRFASGAFVVSVGAASARAGAVSLVPHVRAAHAAGFRTAFTLEFRRRRGGASPIVAAKKSGGKGKGHHAPPPRQGRAPEERSWTEFQADAGEIIEMVDEEELLLSAALIQYAMIHDFIEVPDDGLEAGNYMEELQSIEMRAWPE